MIRSCKKCTPMKGGIRYYGVILSELLGGYTDWDIIEVTQDGKLWRMWETVNSRNKFPNMPAFTVTMKLQPQPVIVGVRVI